MHRYSLRKDSKHSSKGELCFDTSFSRSLEVPLLGIERHPLGIFLMFYILVLLGKWHTGMRWTHGSSVSGSAPHWVLEILPH